MDLKFLRYLNGVGRPSVWNWETGNVLPSFVFVITKLSNTPTKRTFRSSGLALRNEIYLKVKMKAHTKMTARLCWCLYDQLWATFVPSSVFQFFNLRSLYLSGLAQIFSYLFQPKYFQPNIFSPIFFSPIFSAQIFSYLFQPKYFHIFSHKQGLNLWLMIGA